MKSVTDFQLPGNLQASAVFSLQIFMQRTEFSGLFMERVEYLSQWRMVHTMERDLLLESTCLVVELWGGGGLLAIGRGHSIFRLRNTSRAQLPRKERRTDTKIEKFYAHGGHGESQP